MLQSGTEVELTNRFSQQRPANFRVAWVKEQQDSELWETGLECLLLSG